MSLPPGPYRIKSVNTNYFLYDHGTSHPGEDVPTDDKNPPPNSIFSVTAIGGEFERSIQSQSGSSLYVGSEMGFEGFPRLKWQRSAYKWTITKAGEDVWKVQIGTIDEFWYDKFGIGKVVELRKKEGSSVGDEYNWKFIPA